MPKGKPETGRCWFRLRFHRKTQEWCVSEDNLSAGTLRRGCFRQVFFDTYAEALADLKREVAETLRKKGTAEVTVHNKYTGRIRTRWTYPRSSDPRRRRG